jgi:hypothetical protein
MSLRTPSVPTHRRPSSNQHPQPQAQQTDPLTAHAAQAQAPQTDHPGAESMTAGAPGYEALGGGGTDALQQLDEMFFGGGWEGCLERHRSAPRAHKACSSPSSSSPESPDSLQTPLLGFTTHDLEICDGI